MNNGELRVVWRLSQGGSGRHDKIFNRAISYHYFMSTNTNDFSARPVLYSTLHTDNGGMGPSCNKFRPE